MLLKKHKVYIHPKKEKNSFYKLYISYSLTPKLIFLKPYSNICMHVVFTKSLIVKKTYNGISTITTLTIAKVITCMLT